jgi:hypothetical protein
VPASQRLDETREMLAKTQDERKLVTSNIKQNEEFVSNAENPSIQRKSAENMLDEFKARLESLESEEQQRRSREIEAEQQLRAEEVRLSDFHNQLYRLDEALENVSRRPDVAANDESHS